jgi:DNA-binding NarL/FixJ family response regulator
VRVLRVLVCHPHTIFREGVAYILRDAGFDVVATASDAPELVRKARGHRPNVVVMGLPSPDDGDEVLHAAEAVRSDVGAAVLIVSRDVDADSARELLGHGVGGVGYLKTQHVHELTTLTDAVREVADGGSALDPDVVESLVARQGEPDELTCLTPTERRVLALMAEGHSNRGIAEDLVVTVGAIERHVTSIFHKLDLPRTPDRHRRVLAVLRYLEAEVGITVAADGDGDGA